MARRADGIQRTAELLDRHRRVIKALAALPYVRSLALLGRDGPPERPRRRRHRLLRGDRRRTGLHRLHAAVSGQPSHPHARGGLPQLPRRRAQSDDRLSPRPVRPAHQAPLAGPHRPACSVLFDRFVAGQPRLGARLYPSPSRARRSRRSTRWVCSASRSAPSSWAARRSSEFLATVWRFHLGGVLRGAASDAVVSGGILKLHLSDHRRRVLARYEARLDELRARWGAAPRATPAVASA